MSFESGTTNLLEARITELQNEVNSLCRQHGQAERYPCDAPGSALAEDALRADRPERAVRRDGDAVQPIIGVFRVGAGNDTPTRSVPVFR